MSNYKFNVITEPSTHLIYTILKEDGTTTNVIGNKVYNVDESDTIVISCKLQNLGQIYKTLYVEVFDNGKSIDAHEMQVPSASEKSQTYHILEMSITSDVTIKETIKLINGVFKQENIYIEYEKE